MNQRISVVGAGLGGLAAAIRLAKSGFDVTVYEKNNRPGGKMNEYTNNGFRFDTGPSLLTMSFVVDDLFHFAGYDRKNFLEFAEVEPLCRYFFSDQSMLDSFDQRDKMLESLEQFAPGEKEAFLAYMQYCEDLYDHAGGIFLYFPIHEVRKIIRRENLPLLFKLHKLDAWRSVHRSLQSFFKDERLVQLFSRYSTYNGSDPFQAPATLNIIPYVEYNLGAFYIKGGMYRLVESLVDLCRKTGVKIKLNTPVTKIWHQNGSVKGIYLDNEHVESDYVICNSDVVHTFENMIDGHPSRTRRLKRLEPSLSGMVFLWSMKKTYPELAHHNIFFGRNYRHEFQQMFHDRVPAEDPTIYIAITCRTDREHAPRDCENWFVLVNMPYLDRRQNWENYIPRVRNQILKKLSDHGFDIKNNIADERVFTPEHFEQQYGSNRGSIYGLSSNSQFAAFLRPANRSRDIRGLYFASGSAHPGGGIPLVLLSGKLAAELILEKRK